MKEQGNNIARIIALCSELGESVPASMYDRLCASSMQSLTSAADAIRSGQRNCVIAGGVESMSRIKRDHWIDTYPGIVERYDPDDLRMGATAEAVAKRFSVTRRDQDAYAARSQQRACAATENGRFDEEIVPITINGENVRTDEGLRPNTTIDVLSGLSPAFEEGGTVTAGNASQQSGGVAAVLVTSRAFAEERGFDILGIVGDHAVAGVAPNLMGIGPIPACRALFDRADTTPEDYGLVELNEAFASQTVYCRQKLGFNEDRFNVNGGAIAIGHPLGASGTRLPVTLLHEMNRRGVKRGLATLCVGYGQGAVVEFIR